jgi:hypothetical protein
LKTLFLVVALIGVVAAVIARYAALKAMREAEFENEEHVANELSDLPESCPTNLALQHGLGLRASGDGFVQWDRKWRLEPNQKFGDPELLLEAIKERLRQRAVKLGCVVEADEATLPHLKPRSDLSSAHISGGQVFYRYRSAIGVVTVELLLESPPQSGSPAKLLLTGSIYQIQSP